MSLSLPLSRSSKKYLPSIPRSAAFIKRTFLKERYDSIGTNLISKIVPNFQVAPSLVSNFSTETTRLEGKIKDKIYGPLTLRKGSTTLPEIGDYATLPHAFSHDHILTFAKLSGDDNPMHFDDEFARQQGKY